MGLRLRFSSPKRTYRTGETIHLSLALENLSDESMTFTVPMLMDTISAIGDTPYPTNHQFTAVVSAEPLGCKICIDWAQAEALVYAEATILPSGGTYTLDITCLLTDAVEEVCEEKAEPGPIPKNRRVAVPASFAYHDCPGSYRFSAWYKGLPMPAHAKVVNSYGKDLIHWEGQLTTPEMVIRIQE